MAYLVIQRLTKPSTINVLDNHYTEQGAIDEYFTI